MSKRVEGVVGCPECGVSFPVELYQTIWVEYEENRNLILNDEINRTQCPNCGLKGQVQSSILATNTPGSYALWYMPAPDRQAEQISAMLGMMLPHVANAPRLSDWQAFKGTLRLIHSGEIRPEDVPAWEPASMPDSSYEPELGVFTFVGHPPRDRVTVDLIRYRCRKCGEDQEIRVVLMMDISIPENRGEVFADKLNRFFCQKCETVQQAVVSFNAVDTDRNISVYYEPAPDKEIDQRIIGYRAGCGEDSYYVTAPRVADWSAFKETIAKFERGELVGKPPARYDMQAAAAAIQAHQKKSNSLLGKLKSKFARS